MRMFARALALTCTLLSPSIVTAQPPPIIAPADIIASIPCPLLTRPYFDGKPTAQWIPFYEVGGYVRGAPDWRLRGAAYGVPFRQWSNTEFTALKARGRQCNPRPEDAHTLSLLLDAIGRQQTETVGYNERQGAQRNQADARRNAVMAELAAIRQLLEASEQVQRLRQLQSMARSLPDMMEEVTSALDTALIRQDRQRDETGRLTRARQAEEQLAAERQSVERDEAAVRQRKEAFDRAQATRLAMEQETQDAAQAAEQQEAATRRRVEAERATLADRTVQARQALAAQQQAEANEAASAQAARDRAAQVMMQRDAARRAQADDAARQRNAEQQANTPKHRAVVAQAVTVQQGAIAKLGIPERYLGARVMMLDQTMRYVPDVTLRDYLAVLLQSGMTLTGAEARSRQHVVVRSKLPNSPTTTTVWRFDGNELYLAGGGQGDDITDILDRDRPAAEQFLNLGYVLMLNQISETSSPR